MTNISLIKDAAVDWLKDTCFLVHKKPQTLCHHIKNIAALAGCALGLMVATCIAASPKPGLSSNELQYKRQFGPGFLQFDQDHKGKLLVLGAVEDWNGAFAPANEANRDLMKYFHKRYDVSFRAIAHPMHICQQIARAGVPIDALVIQAHGSPQSLQLSSQFSLSTETQFSPDCFKNLREKAVISLDSCSAGLGEKSVAQHLADISGRAVIGAIRDVNADQVIWDRGSKALFHFDSETDSLLSRIFQKESVPQVFPSSTEYWAKLKTSIFGHERHYNGTDVSSASS